MSIVERLREEAQEICADTYPRWKNADESMNAAADEIERLHTLARDAYESWDNDKDAKVGKLLRAMLNETFCAQYRPDLVKRWEDALK
jgi:hypothetical protein